MGRRIVKACKDTQPELQTQAMFNTISTPPPGEGLTQTGSTQTTEAEAGEGMTGTRIGAVQAGDAKLVPDDYKMKVIKYIPTEIIAAYVTLQGIIEASAQAPAGAYWMIFIILLILTPVYVWRITNQTDQKPAWDQIIVSFFSFIIWVMAIGGPFATLPWYQPIYPALLLPIFTLIVPLIKK